MGALEFERFITQSYKIYNEISAVHGLKLKGVLHAITKDCIAYMLEYIANFYYYFYAKIVGK